MPLINNLEREECNIEKIFELCNLTDKSIFIDLGANLGQQVRYLKGKRIKTFAFEPHPVIFKKLEECAGDDENIKLYQKAAWITEQKAYLFFKGTPSAINGGASLIYEKTNIHKGDAFQIETIDFSKFLKELSKEIEVLKIDIEGAEYHLIDYLIKEGSINFCKNLFVEDHERKIFKESQFYQSYIEKRTEIYQFFEKSKINYYNWK